MSVISKQPAVQCRECSANASSNLVVYISAHRVILFQTGITENALKLIQTDIVSYIASFMDKKTSYDVILSVLPLRPRYEKSEKDFQKSQFRVCM